MTEQQVHSHCQIKQTSVVHTAQVSQHSHKPTTSQHGGTQQHVATQQKQTATTGFKTYGRSL